MNKTLRLTAAHVSLVHRHIADTGPVAGFTHFSEADYEDHLAEFLTHRPHGPIAVFCYGSLIWKPAFTPVRSERAVALGWHRSFCLRVARFRGTPEEPGLMMQIDRGGACEGVIQEIDEAGEVDTLRALWRREMTVKPPSNFPRWIEVEANGRRRRAIAFTANPDSPIYAGRLSPPAVAERLATACGHWGSCAEYLHQTITALEREGIHDPYLWDLQGRVAELIERRFPETCFV
ncbi:MAG TPA: gamma-glutamylcyclotransferase [Aestuariivirga sp.]|nr:gamma-glutamylcyclotransferase [Aestuariivirga sp.]